MDPEETTINDLGVGLEEIEKKTFFEGARPGKNKFQKAFLKNFKRHCRGKNKFIFDFSSVPDH